MSSESTRRIAKNTGFLYVRMLLTMGVAFYTSRVVLNALGVEDYGIYNVVGGVVAMFSFLTGMFTSATQRFLNYEMGLGNRKRLNEIFSMSVTLNVMIATLIVLVSEIVGLWFINHKLVIPEDRLMAAHWVFQFSLLAMAVTIISTPYNAVIIAHERMSAFAYIAVVECLLKLGVAIVIVYCGEDKLIVYGTLLLVVAFIVRTIYSLYCKRRFEECHYKFYWDKVLFREMGAFAGWNMYGNFAFVMTTQGVNMLLNMFFGPAVNASRAIAVQIQGAIMGLATNFTMAINPQIVQSYAQERRENMYQYVFWGAKFSFFLLLILIVPILLETEFLLKIWLKQIPDYSVVFVRLILIQTLLWILHVPLHSAIHASGKMKRYQLITGTFSLLSIPFVYMILCLGETPPSVFLVYIGIYFIYIFILLLVLKDIMNFPVKSFISEVLLVVFVTTFYVCFLILPVLYVTKDCSLYLRVLLRELWGEMVCVAIISRIGMKREEREKVKEYIFNIFSNFKKFNILK